MRSGVFASNPRSHLPHNLITTFVLIALSGLISLGSTAVPVAGMQRYYCRLTLVIAVGHSTPPNTLYHNLVVVLCMGMSL